MLGEILVRVGADISDMTRGLQQASRDLSTFGSSASDAGGQIASTFGAAAAAVGGGLGAAVKTAADFDTAMRKAGAIAGANAAELDAMKQSALELGANTSQSASSVADAMTEMAAKGYAASDIIAAMPGVISAAEASGEDLALASDTVATALNIFGLEADQASSVADILAMAANQTAAGIGDMSYALKYAGAPASALGISLEETAAAVGLMTNAGIDGSSAGTALRASLLALNNPAAAQAKIMDQLGISLYDSQGKMKNISGIIAELTAATDGMTEAEKTATIAKLVGTEAASGFLALMEAGPEKIDALTASLENSGGVSQETATQMKEGIGGAMEGLSGAFETLAITVGEQLVPYVQMAADFISNLVNKFNEASPAVQQFVTFGAVLVAAILGIVAVVGTLVFVFGNVISAFGAISGVVSTVVTAFSTGGAAATALSSAFTFLTSPIGLVIAAIVGLVAIFVTAYNKCQWFRDMVNEAWEAIKSAASTAFNAVKDAVLTAVGAIVDFGQEQLGKLTGFWEEHGSQISTFIQTAMSIISVAVTATFGVITTVISTAWAVVQGATQIAWALVSTVISSAIDLVIGIIETGIAIFTGDWEGAWETIKETVSKIADNITSTFDGIDLKKIGKNIIKGLIKGISSMKKSVTKKVKEIAKLIPDKVASFLKMKSPSRLTYEQGQYVGKGLANGIADSAKVVAKATETMAAAAVPSFKQELKLAERERKAAQSAISKAIKSDAEDLNAAKLAALKEYVDAQKNAGLMTVKQEAEFWQYSVTAFKNGTLQKAEALKMFNTAHEELLKEQFENEKKYIEDAKTLRTISMKQEIVAYNKYIKQYKAGSEEYMYYQKAMLDTRQALADKIIQVNDSFVSQMKQINDELLSNEQQLTEDYNKALEDRASTIRDYFGIFDEVKEYERVEGRELTKNLSEQVLALSEWQTQLTMLKNRGVTQALLDELISLGVDATAELQALNRMTDAELTQFQDIYEKKALIAKEAAVAQLKPLADETAAQIEAMREAAKVEFGALETAWILSVDAVINGTESKLNTLYEVGTEAIKGLREGMLSMKGSLENTAKDLAQTIERVIRSSLQVHSPSRLLRKIGVSVGEGLALGLEDTETQVARAAEQLAAAAMVNASPVDFSSSVPGLTRQMEARLQTQFEADEKRSRGDFVLQVDGYELARVQKSHLGSFMNREAALRTTVRGL